MKITKTTKNMAERRGMIICVTKRGSVIKDNGVPRDLVAVMLKLNGEHDVRTTNVEDAMVFYSVSKDGSLEFEVGTSICDDTMFPAIIRNETELRASLDAIRKSLNSVVKIVEVPKWAIPEVVEPVVEPEVVEVPEVLPRLVSVGDDYIPESAVLPHIADIVEDTLSDLSEHSATKTVLTNVLTLLRSPVPEMHEFPEPEPLPAIVETEVDNAENDNPESNAVYVIRHETGKYYHTTNYVSLCWESEWDSASEYFTADRALQVMQGLKYTANRCKVYRREYRG